MHPYYYIRNGQGDVIGLFDANGTIVARYTYDSWGNLLKITDGSGNDKTNDTTFVGYKNPLRYRGYYYDSETKLYYLQSRYYSPEWGRFISADGYVSTGQGLTGTNMFAYCGNNPVMRTDPSGKFWGVIAVVGIIAIALSGCSSNESGYNSAEEAARAFANSVYSSSKYIRHEYGTEIYSKTVNGVTKYDYNPPRSGSPHSIGIGLATPAGTQRVAYVHTHPTSNEFSAADFGTAEFITGDAYVVGPNLMLQKYTLATGAITEIGKISPLELTESQKVLLIMGFKASWDKHAKEDCYLKCYDRTWPTP